MNSFVVKKVISFSKKNPIFKKLLIYTYYKFIHRWVWILRNLSTFYSPIRIPFENSYILMYPYGHIAKTLWLGNFEQKERDFFLKNIEPNTTIINIGSNSGLYTLLAAKKTMSFGEVFSFEASKDNYKLLIKNIHLNKLHNITSYNIAISDSKTEIYLCKDINNVNFDSHYNVQNDINAKNIIDKVNADRIDNILKRNININYEKLFFIVDVEGHEFNVFNGASSLFKEFDNITIMFEATVRINQTLHLLHDHGFIIYKLDRKIEVQKKEIDLCISGTYIAIKNNT